VREFSFLFALWLLLTQGRRWNHVTMLVRMNSPTDTANGQVTLL
jgi:hypothetical protein